MAGRKKINPVVKEDLTTEKTNVEEVTKKTKIKFITNVIGSHGNFFKNNVEEVTKKTKIKFITNVIGSHGNFFKNNVEEVTEKEADYFVKIGVAIKC